MHVLYNRELRDATGESQSTLLGRGGSSGDGDGGRGSVMVGGLSSSADETSCSSQLSFKRGQED